MKLEEDKCLNIFSKMNLNYHKMENEKFEIQKCFDVSLLQLPFIILLPIEIFLLLIIYKYITLKLSLYKYIGEQIN